MDASSLPEFKILSHPTKWDGIDYDHQQHLPSSTTDEDITLNATSSWTYCGPLLPLNAKNLPSSFHTWAQATVNGSIVDPLFSFLEFVHEFLAANNISTYWLTIRASQGSDEFDILLTRDIPYPRIQIKLQLQISKPSLSTPLLLQCNQIPQTNNVSSLPLPQIQQRLQFIYDSERRR
jgi:hypothetical protein